MFPMDLSRCRLSAAYRPGEARADQQPASNRASAAALRVVDDERQLGAGEHHGVAARRLHPADDTSQGGDNLGVQSP